MCFSLDIQAVRKVKSIRKRETLERRTTNYQHGKKQGEKSNSDGWNIYQSPSTMAGRQAGRQAVGQQKEGRNGTGLPCVIGASLRRRPFFRATSSARVPASSFATLSNQSHQHIASTTSSTPTLHHTTLIHTNKNTPCLNNNNPPAQPPASNSPAKTPLKTPTAASTTSAATATPKSP
jgi:hypothetical protein